ncbi:hypothetical protein SDC49_19500 [Lactobacillus sp. R2/2]|nr:hypothetical protein [Lactobacillus sp. R2/2]
MSFAIAHFYGKNSNNEDIDTNTAKDSLYTKNVPSDSTKNKLLSKKKEKLELIKFYLIKRILEWKKVM